MKVKRKVAALLALAMVVTGQPSWVLADGLENLGGTTVVESEDIATPLVPEKETDDLENESTPSDADEVSTAQVDYVILPEKAADDHGATIIGPTTVESDETLEFKVKVRDAYELSYVDVAGAEAEPVSVEDNVYYYEESDIYQDTTVTVYLEEKPEFKETVETDDGLVFEISADAGVLPAGTMVKVNPLAADYADQVKEEVLAEAKVEEEALVETLTEEEAGPLYAAYQIEFVDEEEETLSNSDIGGKVEVSVAMMEDEEAELAVYKVEEKTVEEQEEEAEAEDADENTTAVNQTSVQSLAAKTASVEKSFDIEEVKGTNKITLTKESSNVAVLAVPMPRAEFKDIDVYLGATTIDGEGYLDHEWCVVNERGAEIQKDDPDYPSWLEISNTNGKNLHVNIEYDSALIGKEFYLKHTWNWGFDSETFHAVIKEGNETAYFYVKKAEFADGNLTAGTDPKNYKYWGPGTIPFGPAEKYGVTGHKTLTDEIKADMIFGEPTEEAKTLAPKYGYDTDGYPILQLDENNPRSDKYYYIYSEAQEAKNSLNKYAIDWRYYSTADGAVGYRYIYGQEDDPIVEDRKTWHVDADVYLFDENDIQIFAYWQTAGDIDTENFSGNHTKYMARTQATAYWDNYIQARDGEVEETLDDGYHLNWYFDSEGVTPYTRDQLEKWVNDSEYTEAITLYGIIEEETKYELSYDGNENTGGEAPAGGEYVAGKNITLAEAGSLVRADAVFLGWSEEAQPLVTTQEQEDGITILEAGSDYTMPAEKTTLYAVWAENTNGGDTPDYQEEKYELSYDGNENTGGEAPAGGEYVAGKNITLAEAGSLVRKDAVFLGWSEEAQPLVTTQEQEDGITILEAGSNYTMPAEKTTLYAVWASDIDGDGNPDYREPKFDLTYDANGGVGGPANEPDAYINKQTVELATASEPTREKAVFLGWSENQIEEILEKAPTDDTIVTEVTFGEADKTVYAVWAADENKDGVIDADQTRVALRPYATSIYTGGESEYEDYAGSGFPALELELKYGDAFNGPEEQGARRVNNALVTEVNINGKWLPSAEGDGINKYLEAIYVYADEAGNYHRITNDTKYRPEGYIAVIAVKDTALKEAFSGTMENGEAQYVSENGFVRNNKTGRFVTISKSSDEGISSIGVRAYVDKVGGTLKDYFVNIETSSLTIRQVNNDPNTSIREMVDTEDEAIALNAQDLAAARPGEEGTVAFYTNGDEQRAAATEDDIRLLVDDVKDQDNRISLLEDKAFNATYGMTVEEAEAQGYDSQLKYLDLVDTGNGNAWVESATGTYVYWPYPEGTDKNTEFTLRHFVGLDRETQYDGADAVADAITDAKMEDENYLQMEKTDEGIRFFTTGKLAFSPFILMWKTDDGNGGGGNDHDSTTGGSGTVADPYVVRLHGNWVHMDPNDIFKPISEPVPEGATPVTNPEWHQWKFILNNGTMLFNRWAYIRNPYAVGDQPREGWFYFNRDGIMQYGWYRDEATGKWYYAHRESDGMLGTLRYGWHHDDQDGRWYYLDPTTGEMLLGWRQIDGKWYYFNPYAPEVTWNYNEATGGWTYNGSTSRPYGSMYQNEMTPDGYQVDENGAWVQ